MVEVAFKVANEHGFNTKKCSVAMSFRIWNAQITLNRAKRGGNPHWQNQIQKEVSMSKHKPDVRIGIRASEELHRVFPNLTEACIVQNLGLERKSFWCWRNGIAPSGFALQRMCFAGCDVNYILTGRRSQK